jgi:hypothetical protein
LMTDSLIKSILNLFKPKIKKRTPSQKHESPSIISKSNSPIWVDGVVVSWSIELRWRLVVIYKPWKIQSWKLRLFFARFRPTPLLFVFRRLKAIRGRYDIVDISVVIYVNRCRTILRRYGGVLLELVFFLSRNGLSAWLWPWLLGAWVFSDS